MFWSNKLFAKMCSCKGYFSIETISLPPVASNIPSAATNTPPVAVTTPPVASNILLADRIKKN